jgi:hypothetical protein
MARGPNGATSSAHPSKNPKKANQATLPYYARIVILSEAKDLLWATQILSEAKDDR